MTSTRVAAHSIDIFKLSKFKWRGLNHTCFFCCCSVTPFNIISMLWIFLFFIFDLSWLKHNFWFDRIHKKGKTGIQNSNHSSSNNSSSSSSIGSNNCKPHQSWNINDHPNCMQLLFATYYRARFTRREVKMQPTKLKYYTDTHTEEKKERAREIWNW